MFVYSNKIYRYIKEIKLAIREILTNEIKVRINGERFFDSNQRNSYPISVVIYNDSRKLGYFDPEFYQLGFHECLMQGSREQLHNVVRHELAHYMVFINNNSSQFHGHPHSPEFRAFCMRMEWGPEVYSATMHLEESQSFLEQEQSSVFRKVQKLMALSGSSNQNEAEQAMIKSQQLLLKHNIESTFLTDDGDEKIFLKRIMKQKRINAKMQAIAKILETYFVNIVFSRSQGFIYLEILGSAVNLEIAEYVADFLHTELENLWSFAQFKHTQLKGATAKNSFFLGIARGYCDKINFLKKEYVAETKNALMIIEKKLMDAADKVYSRLKQTRSHANFCPTSSALGEKMGRELQINSAINSSKNSSALISYSGA
ncbi:MAG: DUF2786 domain-containing protein [Parachlamydiaceae bacterium]|nr:DUF2786 domain-containing protein [Parachlamydiaceae bacterium]